MEHGIKYQTHVPGSLCTRGSGRMFSGWWFPRQGACILKWRLDQRSLSWIKGSWRLGVDGNLIPKRKRWHWLWSVECHEPLEENSNSHVVCCVCLFYDMTRLQNSRFFSKISKEIGKAWRKSLARLEREPHTPVGRVRREKKNLPVSPLSRSLFSALFQTFWLTARAYLNTQNTDCFAVYDMTGLGYKKNSDQEVFLCHRLPETVNEPFFSQYLVSFVRFTEVVACRVWTFR